MSWALMYKLRSKPGTARKVFMGSCFRLSDPYRHVTFNHSATQRVSACCSNCVAMLPPYTLRGVAVRWGILHKGQRCAGYMGPGKYETSPCRPQIPSKPLKTSKEPEKGAFISSCPLQWASLRVTCSFSGVYAQVGVLVPKGHINTRVLQNQISRRPH